MLLSLPSRQSDGERKRERKERRDAKTVRREEREKKKEEQRKLDEKLKRKEDRRRIREERKKRRAARKKKEEVKAYDASSSKLSSSSDDGDDDASYHVFKGDKKKKNKDKSSCTNKKNYAAVSFNYSYLTNRDRKSFINVPAGKLPHFDGTNFTKWKHLMRAYLIGLHPGLWEIVCSGFEPPEDLEEPTNEELTAVHLNGQATSILLSALDGNEYNRVMNVDIAKQIWDTLHLAHEGVDKVRRVKIDLLMAKLNSEDESDGTEYTKIDDIALFMRKYNKGLKKQGYKVVRRKFPNKKKRLCFNCGSTEHLIAKCPYEKKDNNNKKDKKESKHEHKKSHKQVGEAHIGHEWDSTKESSSDEDENMATVAIQKTSSTPRLFNNMSDDDDISPHICLMAKGEKVQSKAKSSPPPNDISSSDLSDSSSDDESSDEEIDNITKNLDPKTKLFISKLMEDLESVQTELEAKYDDLLELEKMYVANKEALALERSEVASLHKAWPKSKKTMLSQRSSQEEQVDSSVVGKEDPPCEAIKQLAIGDIRPQEDQAAEEEDPQAAAAQISADVLDAEVQHTPAGNQ
ncbi:uncharacterized protein [Miscanthus floridulus]|uniref:uncharacterized protein n=1 Tax=Miscanthus floridulus TaxID=154761 RepID=UPI0034591F25